MKVKGILVEGTNGETFLLGIGPRSGGAQAERPTIWKVTGANYDPLEETRTASVTIRERLGLEGAKPVPGQTHDEHVKRAVLEALTGFITKFFGEVRW